MGLCKPLGSWGFALQSRNQTSLWIPNRDIYKRNFSRDFKGLLDTLKAFAYNVVETTYRKRSLV